MFHAVVSDFPRREVSAAYSYPHYPARDVYSLTGNWQFAFLNASVWNASAIALPTDISFNSTQTVPSAWDAKWGTGLQYSRGAGVYRANVAIPAGRPAALHFEACSIYCRVFVDGAEVANSTAGGFTPFWVSVPSNAKKADRTVTVVASNVFDPVLTPTQAAYYDFYQYGGIIREATLHVLPKAGLPSVQRVVVAPLGTKKGGGGAPSGKANVTIVLRDAPKGKSVALGLCFDAAATAPCAASAKKYAHVNGVVVVPAVAVPNPKIWSPTSPKLHTLTVAVHADADGADSTVDSILVRFGLRTVQASGRHVLINGKPTKLHGYNRHDMYPQLGPSMTPALYDADLALLQGTRMEGNFIRGSHYPQDPRFLDRCDENGVMVWEETLAWGNSMKILTEPAFLSASLETANAMLDRDTNHPAIIFWGFFNEGQSDNNASCPAYGAMSKTFKRRDQTRLVTWADNRGSTGLCYEYADVVSNNFYPGWYNGPASGIAKTWSDRAAWCATAYPNKPFIISETGAGGIVGEHSKNQSRWSLEYQATVDGDNADIAMSDANITGLALWQFCDIKVDQSNTSSGRPGGINNKGVVSQWRATKPAAAVVAAAYAKV